MLWRPADKRAYRGGGDIRKRRDEYDGSCSLECEFYDGFRVHHRFDFGSIFHRTLESAEASSGRIFFVRSLSLSAKCRIASYSNRRSHMATVKDRRHKNGSNFLAAAAHPVCLLAPRIRYVAAKALVIFSRCRAA